MKLDHLDRHAHIPIPFRQELSPRWGATGGVSRLARDEEEEIDVVSTASAQTRFHFGAPAWKRADLNMISTFQDDCRMISDFKMKHVGTM